MVFFLGGPKSNFFGNAFAKSLGNDFRMTVPSKPHLCAQALGNNEDYAELSTKFKGSHVKTLLWWLAVETVHWADKNPNEPCYPMLWVEGVRCEKQFLGGL